MKKTLKAASFYLILIVWLLIASLIEAHAAPINRAAKRQITQFVRSEYRGYRVKIAPAEQTPDSVIENRMDKRIVYIDQFVTKSRGGYGVVTTKGPFKGNRMAYENYHKRGKTVVVYLIYNPFTNYSDDVVAFVEGGKLIYKPYF